MNTEHNGKVDISNTNVKICIKTIKNKYMSSVSDLLYGNTLKCNKTTNKNKQRQKGMRPVVYNRVTQNKRDPTQSVIEKGSG